MKTVTKPTQAPAWSPMLERANRVAAEAHNDQTRKASGVPYITHPFAVAMILQRYGFDDDVTLAAALLHDVVEDTSVTIDELAAQFPVEVVEAVAHLSERKCDEQGRPRAWEDRKHEHLEHIATAPLGARAIAIADKLHNLTTMQFDLDNGEDLSERFNASFDRLGWYYEAMIAAAHQSETCLDELAIAAQLALTDVMNRVGSRVGSSVDGNAVRRRSSGSEGR